MIVSKYTFLIPYSDKYYLYNSLSNALLELDGVSYSCLEKCRREQSQVSKESFSDELYEMLTRKHFIVDNDYDEYLLYKSMMLTQRGQQTFMHLTLAPTMECNFRCFYCFETEKPKGKMSPGTMDSIVKYIISSRQLEKIYLTWFGGEPLMALDEMVTFYDKLKAAYHKDFASNIITTGYYLDRRAIDVLQRICVGSVQITLDGNREHHNKIKRTQECPDVFGRVLENIDILTATAPDIDVAFRINLTRQNIDDFTELYRYLAGRYRGKKVVIVPAFVRDRTDFSHDNSYCVDREGVVRFVLDQWNSRHIYSPWLEYPSSACNECAVRDRMSMSFDSEGYAYKCWETIGNRKHAIGKIKEDGTIGNVNTALLNRQLYGADIFDDDQCRECAYLPICHGGCPMERIENRIDGKHNDVCTSHKGHIEEFMKIHIDLLNKNRLKKETGV